MRMCDYPPRNGCKKLDQVRLYHFVVQHYRFELLYCLLASLYGILPTLEFGDKTLSGNGNIARYLAEKYGE